MKVQIINEVFVPSVKIGNSMGPEDTIFENNEGTSYVTINSKRFANSLNRPYKEIFNVVYCNSNYEPALKFSVFTSEYDQYYMEINSRLVNRKTVSAFYDDPDLDVASIANRVASEIFKPITVWDDAKSIAYIKKIVPKARKAFADANTVEVY